jgi:hypothetical protein
MLDNTGDSMFFSYPDLGPSGCCVAGCPDNGCSGTCPNIAAVGGNDSGFPMLAVETGSSWSCPDIPEGATFRLFGLYGRPFHTFFSLAVRSRLAAFTGVPFGQGSLSLSGGASKTQIVSDFWYQVFFYDHTTIKSGHVEDPDETSEILTNTGGAPTVSVTQEFLPASGIWNTSVNCQSSMSGVEQGSTTVSSSVASGVLTIDRAGTLITDSAISFPSGGSGTISRTASLQGGIVGDTSPRVVQSFDVAAAGWTYANISFAVSETGDSALSAETDGAWYLILDSDADGLVSATDPIISFGSGSVVGTASDSWNTTAMVLPGHYLLELDVAYSASSDFTSTTCGQDDSQTLSGYNDASVAISFPTVHVPALTPSSNHIQSCPSASKTLEVAPDADTILQWEWRKNGLRIFDSGRFAGSATDSLAISGVQQTDAGDYSVNMVTNWGTAPATCRLSVTNGDFNGDGDVGTESDITAFFSCCYDGVCCSTCQTADQNGDGDVGTDADIETFFRVLTGGSCN